MIKTGIMKFLASESKFVLIMWFIFIILLVIMNKTIYFIFGIDVKDWTNSKIKSLLINVIIYGFVFFIIPILYVKKNDIKGNWILISCLLCGLLGLFLSTYSKWFNLLLFISVFILLLRGDLYNLGFEKIKIWEYIIMSIIYILLYSIPSLFSWGNSNNNLNNTIISVIDRMFLNPASTVEYIFYYGFLGKRLILILGKILTPIILGLMYVLHEMSNPEYWYENVNFLFIFIGVSIVSVLFFWKKNLIPVWIGDGIGRFIIRIF